MSDADAMTLASDPTATTELAAYLNAAMARSPQARAAYAALYGAEWSSLGDGTEINDGATATAATRC